MILAGTSSCRMRFPDYDTRNAFLNYPRDTDIETPRALELDCRSPAGKGKPLVHNAGKVLISSRRVAGRGHGFVTQQLFHAAYGHVSNRDHR
jgi:hypothetical protein